MKWVIVLAVERGKEKLDSTIIIYTLLNKMQTIMILAYIFPSRIIYIKDMHN